MAEGRLWVPFICLMPLVVYCIYHVESRYVFAYSWIIVLFLGALVRGACCTARSRTMAVDTILVVLLVATTTISMWRIPYHAVLLTDEPLEHREAGLWMRNNIPSIEETSIASRKPFVSYYSGAGFVDGLHESSSPLDPGLAPDEFIKTIKKRGANYLIVDKRYLINYRPQLASLLDPDEAKEISLTPLHVIETEGGDYDLIIYGL